MADGDRAGACFGDPGSSGRRGSGRGSAIAPASESGQGHKKVGGEGRAQLSGTSAWPSPGATRGLRRPYVTLCHRMEEGRLWRNANAPNKGTERRDHES